MINSLTVYIPKVNGQKTCETISLNHPVQKASKDTILQVSDLWQLAQRVGKAIEPHFGASSLTLAIQVVVVQ